MPVTRVDSITPWRQPLRFGNDAIVFDPDFEAVHNRAHVDRLSMAEELFTRASADG